MFCVKSYPSLQVHVLNLLSNVDFQVTWLGNISLILGHAPALKMSAPKVLPQIVSYVCIGFLFFCSSIKKKAWCFFGTVCVKLSVCDCPLCFQDSSEVATTHSTSLFLEVSILYFECSNIITSVQRTRLAGEKSFLCIQACMTNWVCDHVPSLSVWQLFSTNFPFSSSQRMYV